MSRGTNTLACCAVSKAAIFANGKYDPVPTSPIFPLPISPADIMAFVAMRSQMDDNAVIRQFRAWIQSRLAATQP